MSWLSSLRRWKRESWQSERTKTLQRIASLEERLEKAESNLEYSNYVVGQLVEELFDVPQLPPTKFMEHPLGDKLGAARNELDAFLGEVGEVSTSEQRYLLMQMFFRGPMEGVYQQVSAILNDVDIPEDCRTLPVADVGCGRGELLRVLRERGFEPLGIDTSELMINNLAEQQYSVMHGDAVGCLNQLEDQSLAGVTAFHVVEHVEPKYFRTLLELAFQKVAPGGFILIETPNPFCFESLSFFYTDDTHVRPIQPYQLAFLAESVGFERTRLHFSAPVPIVRRQAAENWMRQYQNHGLVAYKPRQIAHVCCQDDAPLHRKAG